MKNIRFLSTLLAFTLLLVSCSSDTLTPDQFIDEAATRFSGRASGISIKVFTNDEILFESTYGYGNMAEQLEVDEETVFEWGSITRTLVWISVLQLVEQGELDLHTDIGVYLPDDLFLELKYPTTLFHLMTHSAGWPDFSPLGVFFEQNNEGMLTNGDEGSSLIGNLLRNLEMPPQLFQPGDVSDLNDSFSFTVVLVSYIVEQVSGMAFHEYVQQNIFHRLDMAHTAILSDSSDNLWVQQQLARQNCYAAADGVVATRVPLFSPIFMLGGAVSTPSDFQRFTAALLPDDSGGSALFERQETVDLLHNSFDYDPSSETDNANGIIFQNGQVCHTVSLLIDTNRGMGVVVMTNQERERFFNRPRWLTEVIDRFAAAS